MSQTFFFCRGTHTFPGKHEPEFGLFSWGFFIEADFRVWTRLDLRREELPADS